MKYQKICIIGDGLTGLTTAIALKKLNLDIDLFFKKNAKNKKIDNRVTAISDSNFKFLKREINFKNSKIFWSCKKINLFFEDRRKYINFLNYDEDQKNLMHIFENKNFIKNLNTELKKNKNIKFFNKSIEEINYTHSFVKFGKKINYYDLIILCAGNKSNLYRNISEGRSINRDYKEFAVTGTVKHNLKIKSPRQYFLKEGPLAILPFKKNMFSLVWSISESNYKKNIEDFLKKKLISIFGKKQNIKVSKLQSFPLHLNLKTKYYKKNVLILGQGIHSIHPISGQGFNLILRDIEKLSSIIEKNLSLGLLLKDSYTLEDFYNSRNPENTLIGLGNDLIYNFFKENKIIDPMKSILLKNISKFGAIKNISRILSDKGIFV